MPRDRGIKTEGKSDRRVREKGDSKKKSKEFSTAGLDDVIAACMSEWGLGKWLDMKNAPVQKI